MMFKSKIEKKKNKNKKKTITWIFWSFAVQNCCSIGESYCFFSKKNVLLTICLTAATDTLQALD